MPMLKNNLPLSVHSFGTLTHRQDEYLKAMQDIVGHFCHESTHTVFCQLCHGLVRQFIQSVSDHNNEKFLSYLDEMQAQQCSDPKSKALKKCKIFSVLRKGIPGSYLGAKAAVSSAEANTEKVA